jgi:hypothetical protein
MVSSGLLSGGKSVSSRQIRDALLAKYVVNGSGLFLTRAVSDDGNRTMRFGSDVGGVIGTELLFSGVSLGISVVNCIGIVGVWVRYVRDLRGALQIVRVSEEGDVEVRGLRLKRRKYYFMNYFIMIFKI